MSAMLRQLFGTARPMIGMLHAPPLPGSPGHDGDWPAVVDRVLADARALAEGGMHGLMLENFGDAPFFPGRVPAATVAAMTALALEVRRTTALPLGINVLRNDGRSALAVAKASGARFIRVNVLCGARVTDQGIIEGIAHDLARDRRAIDADHVALFADVNVKHSAPVATIPRAQEVHDLIERGGATAVIVSGTGTGTRTDRDELETVKQAAGDTAVLLGSGVTPENVADYLQVADGAIVGSSLKYHGEARDAVDVERVRRLVAACAIQQ